MTLEHQFPPPCCSGFQLCCNIASRGRRVLNHDGRLVVIVAFEGATLLEIVGPAEVFDVAVGYAIPPGHPGYEVEIVSAKGGSIRASSGLMIGTRPWSAVAQRNIDTIIVPGGGPPWNPPVPPEVVTMLRALAPKARRVCSICTGTFLLAAAGLADGRRVTTHWQAAELLRERYPAVRVDADPVFVTDGPIWSAAGFTAGIDMALALLEEDEGHYVAMTLARVLILFLKRPGAQSQFSLPLATQMAGDGAFAGLHAFIIANLTADLSVEKLAAQAGMSPRTFARRYAQRTNSTPARTVTVLRLDEARRLLTETDLSLKEIARMTGLAPEQNLRRAFQREMGVTPQLYRERFGSTRVAPQPAPPQLRIVA